MKKKDDDIDNFDFSGEAAFNKRFRRIEGKELEELRACMGRASRSEIKSQATSYPGFDIEELKDEILADKEFLRKLKSALASLSYQVSNSVEMEMSGHDYPIEHFQLMVDVSNHLKKNNAQLLKHEYHYDTFGSWWFVFKQAGQNYRLMFDGRDNWLRLEREISKKAETLDWEEFATMKFESSSRPTLGDIDNFLRGELSPSMP